MTNQQWLLLSTYPLTCKASSYHTDVNCLQFPIMYISPFLLFIPATGFSPNIIGKQCVYELAIFMIIITIIITTTMSF